MYKSVFRTDGKGGLQRLSEVLAPLQPGMVRVAVRALSLNFRDHYFIRGNRFRDPIDGRIPMTDAVGIVEEVGDGVTRFAVGDRVCSTVLPHWLDGPLNAAALGGSIGSSAADGVLASHFDASEHALVSAPAHLSDIEAATLPVAALTAWHAVAELGVVHAGDTVVVQTTGGVAVFAMQFAQALGARVIAVSRSAAKLARTEAWATIDSSHLPEWDREVQTLTSNQGARLVLDMGLSDSLRRATRAVAFEGTVAIIGVVQEHVNPLDIFTVMNKNLNVRGVETGSRAMFERMNAFLVQRDLHPHIDAVFDVDHIEAALDRLAASPFGKIVLTLPAHHGKQSWT
ncbi:zinc-dependent alcohol dehydrogenase family protein [Massilia phyllosphaerae]|uniref:zinc-dependent alcohol dehydrogenase family protein n=1 Tax=Massilia phyllosphaerae TaxID=3106034 RepID=UPI002B1CCB4E|nr:NAD(P)-dependent alcohol dehydrogenase [Massilia sp. SGZ-792]